MSSLLMAYYKYKYLNKYCEFHIAKRFILFVRK